MNKEYFLKISTFFVLIILHLWYNINKKGKNTERKIKMSEKGEKKILANGLTDIELKMNKTVASRLKGIRKGQRISNMSMAEKLGTNSSKLSILERGFQKITVLQFMQYCQICGISPNNLLGWDEEAGNFVLANFDENVDVVSDPIMERIVESIKENKNLCYSYSQVKEANTVYENESNNNNGELSNNEEINEVQDFMNSPIDSQNESDLRRLSFENPILLDGESGEIVFGYMGGRPITTEERVSLLKEKLSEIDQVTDKFISVPSVQEEKIIINRNIYRNILLGTIGKLTLNI